LTIRDAWMFFCIASDGSGWEHVSVHAFQLRKGRRIVRTPTWDEMCWIKATFWDDDDVVVQFHPRKRDYVNAHPATLHLWRSTAGDFPRPDPILVGPVARDGGAGFEAAINTGLDY